MARHRQVYGNEEGTVWCDHEGIKIKTDKAILFLIHGEEVWIPRSQIEDFSEEYVGITPWIAQQKGLESDW